MHSISPSRSDEEATARLETLLTPAPTAAPLQAAIGRLNSRFSIYAATCPSPLPAAGLIITPEIRHQSELYLPIDEIAAVFNRLYRFSLRYPPILSSTPFHTTSSWADLFAGLPPHFQGSANPARLLEELTADRDLLVEFLFTSFLPHRFYGGFARYPEQREFIRHWLTDRKTPELRCLDAACGTGEESYGLARLMMEQGIPAENLNIEGWTIEPLEVWAAAYGCFPHDRQREALFRAATAELFRQRFHTRIRFLSRDLLDPPSLERFDLILCNGLLGGPIIHQPDQMERVVRNLSRLLAPGGIMLVADSFHGGWKQQCPQPRLRALLETTGLKSFEAGEGIGGGNHRSGLFFEYLRSSAIL